MYACKCMHNTGTALTSGVTLSKSPYPAPRPPQACVHPSVEWGEAFPPHPARVELLEKTDMEKRGMGHLAGSRTVFLPF